MTKDEIQDKINQDLNILEQHDYTARPVAFEVARLFKAQHPEIETPVLDKYLEIENEADALRAEIRELREQLENTAE